MKKILIVVLLIMFTLVIAGCGESLKTKSKLSVPADQNKEDNTLQTGRVAGEQDINTVQEKPLSPETF